MSPRKTSSFFAVALAGTGATAVFLAPIPPAYGLLIVLAAVVEIARGDGRGELLPRGILTTIGLAGFFFTLLPFRRETLAEQSLAALCILLAVKLLETKKRRDHLQILALSAILTAGAGSLAPEMAFGVLLLAICVLGTLDLVWLPFAEVWPSDETAPGLFARLFRLTLVMLVISIPLAVALFVVLPRSMNPFWGGLVPTRQRVSGFSDDLTLGDVGRLALSGETAFRAEMNDPAAPLAEIPYWRGVVMEETDGRRWSSRPGGVAVKAGMSGDIRITYFVEPHGRHQLFLLEQPRAAYRKLRALPIDSAGVLRLRRAVTRRTRYVGLSYPDHGRKQRISPEERNRNLRLPDNISPAVRALAAELAGENGSPPETAARFISFFNDNFTYTLDVPPEAGDPLEEFLLRRRTGYCEYFASAMAVMLRAEGVPARVVAGYLGGEYSTGGNYYLVRQSDAHAWVEAWLGDNGWTRLDPTPTAGEFGGTIASRSEPPTRLWLDLLRMKWNSWIVQYDAEVQMGLVKKGVGRLFRLRLPTPSLPEGKTWFWLLTIPLFAAAIRLIRLRSAGPLPRRFLRLQGYVRRRSGLVREPWEGPLAYGRRAAGAVPEKKDDIEEFAERWASLRYGSDGPPGRDDLAGVDELLRRITNGKS